MVGITQYNSSLKTKLLLLILIFLCFVLNMRAFGQQIPPLRIRGFSDQNRRYVHLDSITMEAFLDQICPYSKASWPSLKQAADFYPSHLSLVVHLFPLPYHDNAFAVSRALHTVYMMNASATFPMLEVFFKHQERFNHNETRHLSRTSIVNEIVKFTAGILGDSYHNALKSGFQNDETDFEQDCPLSMGLQEGVYGTPFFVLNGFYLPNAGASTNFSEWTKLIEPLSLGGGGQNGKKKGTFCMVPLSGSAGFSAFNYLLIFKKLSVVVCRDTRLILRYKLFGGTGKLY